MNLNETIFTINEFVSQPVNQIWQSVRDALLNKNIINPIKYPSYSTSINGSPRGGEPVLDTSIGNDQVNQQPTIEESYLPRYINATVMNRYREDSTTAGELRQITDSNLLIPTNGQYDRNGKLLTDSTQIRKDQIKPNQYFDVTQQIDSSTQLNQDVNHIPQGNYLDIINSLDIRKTSAKDIVNTILNGQGVGIGVNGLVDNFDVRTTLINRAIDSGNDTRLGQYNARQLGFSILNNILFNTQQSILGQINLNPLNILMGGDIIKPDYRITVSRDLKFLNYAEKILGVESPVSLMGPEASIFSTESKLVDNISRANSLLEFTGKGQKLALLNNMLANHMGIGFGDNPSDSPFRSGYVPGYMIDGKLAIDGNPSIYLFGTADGKLVNILSSVTSETPIADIMWKRRISDYGFKDTGDDYTVNHISTPTFSWGSTLSSGVNVNSSSGQIDTTNKKSLLAKTQKLFNSEGMRNIVSVKGLAGEEASQIQTSVYKGMISKGSAVKSSDALSGKTDTPDNVFCRSWTTFNRYDSISKLVRKQALNTDRNGNTVMGKEQWRLNTNGSVLQEGGMVKIAPYKTDDFTRKAANTKRYMFSIENLAWAGGPANRLLPIEQGPGDLVSEKFGRIMWFPPYDLNFTENDTANWESTQFIGRGEPVYTYSNTERSGTLSFKIIVDHPSVVNSFAGLNGVDDDYFASYIAGCVDLDKKLLDRLTIDEIEILETTEVPTVNKIKLEEEIAPPPFSVYFLNDITKVNTDYENGDGNGIGTYSTEPQKHNGKSYKSRTLIDSTDYGLNAQPIELNGITYPSWTNTTFQDALKTHITEKCPSCRLDITGYANSQGWADANLELSKNRANNFYDWALNNFIPNDDIRDKRKRVIQGKGALSNTGTNSTPTDDRIAKVGRKIDIKFVPDANLQAQRLASIPVEKPKTETRKVNKKIKKRFYNEASFFEKLTKKDPFVFDQIRKKLKYFHPAFHSTTPEGLNSRLTFLKQCTRQGPTLGSDRPDNLAFGAPPVCILRLGDFYNTKIIIENIGFSFEPLVWDLNPEGVGVQPMIANVDMSIKFVGGSALEGPINRLQNALSFNYFANTQVYDARADYIALDDTTEGDLKKYKVVDGIKNLNVKGEVDNSLIISQSDYENGVKQSDNAEASSSGQSNQETPSPIESDMKKISIIRVTTDSDVIRPELAIDGGLSQQYEFKAILLDSVGTQLKEIGSGTITPGDLYQKFDFNGSNNLLTTGKNYFVQIKMTSTQKTALFIP